MQVEKELLALFITNVKQGSPQKRVYIFLTDATVAIVYCLQVDNYNTWRLKDGYDKVHGRIMHSRLAAHVPCGGASAVPLTFVMTRSCISQPLLGQLKSA